MEEVPLAGEDHHEPELVGRLDDGFVTHRAAGLDDRRDAGRGGRFDSVFERVERVARGRTAVRPTGRLLRRDLSRLDPALLPGPDPDRLAILDEHDGVRLHMTAEPPRELEIGPL